MGFRNAVKRILRMCGHAMVSTVHERLDRMERELEDIAQGHTALLQSNIHLVETIPQLRAEIQALRPIRVEVSTSPEAGLMGFLYSYLPSRGALVIGAQTKSVSEDLLSSGYEVYAVEPDVVPGDASLVRIGAGETGLEVIRKMGGHRYPVVVVGLSGLSELAGEMRGRGYSWFIVLYRASGQDVTSFFCNQDVEVPGSSGDAFFFDDREMFRKAQEWCSAVLPRTYFKPSG